MRIFLREVFSTDCLLTHSLHVSVNQSINQKHLYNIYIYSINESEALYVSKSGFLISQVTQFVEHRLGMRLNVSLIT